MKSKYNQKNRRRQARPPKPIRQANSDNPTAGLMLFLSRSEKGSGRPGKTCWLNRAT